MSGETLSVPGRRAAGARSRTLARLLHPRSIAVFGGGFWGPNVVEQCLKMGFAGPVWPVHPTRAEMHGLPCYRTVEELPEAPDAAFIGVNRNLTIEIVERLVRRGAGGAVCFASGFREADDAALEEALVATAGEMPILGPNCYGLINYLDGALLWPDQHGGARVDRGVAIITQSSNMLINITMQTRALPIAYAAACGNQAQVDMATLASAFLDDPRVTAVGLHIEGIKDIRAFEGMAAKARACAKPVVALKVGRSAEAQSATVSHTASLTGSDAGGRAFLARLGVGQVESLPEFLETLKFLHVLGPLPGREICSVSCSGGEASLMADAAHHRGLTFRPLAGAERARVKATLSEIVAVANPLDYHTFIWGDEAAMTATFTAMVGCGFDLSVFVYDFPRTDRCDDAAWECGVNAVAAARDATGARVAVAATLGEAMPEVRAGQLMALGIAPMAGLDEALAAAEAAAGIGEAWARPEPAPVLPPGTGGAPRTLDEAEAKAALAAHGVAVPAGRVAESADDAARAAAEAGFPVALKGLGIAHKTETGAVRLALADAGAVREAAGAMAAERFLVERMVAGAVAELIVGVVRDPAHGFVLTLGAGGVLTELVADSASLLVPATAAEVRAALDGLKVSRLLAGYRGKPAADIDAVVAAVMAVQDYVAAEAARLDELDINPLMATQAGAVAADALIRLREET